MPIGLVRNKTHSQALEKPIWKQERFDGGLDIDLPGTKIGTNELAVCENIIAYEDYLEGGTGRRLYTSAAMPGVGVFHGWYQHPKHKRVLLYRGSQVWLSSDATLTAWSECVSPGPNGGESVTTTVTISGSHSITLTLRGLTAGNTNGYTLYGVVAASSGLLTFKLYRDPDNEHQVAEATGADSGTDFIVAPINTSWISGDLTWDGSSTANGTYSFNSNLVFSAGYQGGEVFIDDGDVKIDILGNNFVLFVRDTESGSRTVFVDVSQLQYWMLSTVRGYGPDPIKSMDDSGEYKYRYLFTLLRLVDPTTGNPSRLSRLDATLLFEGPSNAIGTQDLDYATVIEPVPIDEGDNVTIPLVRASDGTTPIGIDAANYINGIGIYRTLDVGVNGIDPNSGVGNNSEIYVWVNDVPIDQAEYTDFASDDTLRYRFQAGFGLHTRFFTEMQSGIGSIGPDFMYTSTPLSQRVDYCPLNNPAYVGYFNAALQNFNTKDIVEQIIRTRTTFVIMCRGLTMTSVSQIYQDVGTTEFIPVIQDFQPASDAIGITSFNSWCRLDDSTFAALCSDSTIRIFATGRWGNPLDSDKVHRQIILAMRGASLGFVRGALYVFYNTADADQLLKCFRYGFGGLSAYKWSTVARTNWIHPHVGLNCLLMEDINEVRRLLQIDDAANACFSFEDPEGIRVWKDDTVNSNPVFSGDTAARWSDLQLTGFTGVELFGTYAGGDNHSITFYLSASDRDNFINPVLFGNLTDEAGATVSLTPQSGSGITGSVVFDGNLAGPDGDLNVSFTGSSGTAEIPCRWRPRELTGGQINYTLFHEESHLTVLPVDDVLPDGFAIAVQGYANGVAVPGAYIPAAAYNGAIAYQANLEGTRIQNEFTTTTSRFRIASMNTQYQSHDMKSTTGPQSTTESAYQKELAGPFSVWLSRYTTPFYRNRADGKKMGDPTGTPDLVTDPTGRNWAMQMFNISPDVVATPLTETRAISVRSFLWYMSAWPQGQSLFRVFVGATESFYIRISGLGVIDINGQTFDISAYPAGTWRCFAVVIDATEIRLYIDGMLITTFAVVMDPATGDNLIIGSDEMGDGDTGAVIFDPRWTTNALSAGAINYYVRDITLNEGRKVLP